MNLLMVIRVIQLLHSDTRREVTSHSEHTAVWLAGLQDQFSSLTADVDIGQH